LIPDQFRVIVDNRTKMGDGDVNRRSAIVVCLGLSLAVTAAPAATYARSGETSQKCERIGIKGVKDLFARWNEALEDPSANKVVALYANDATLLPTVENGPYTKAHGLKEYFIHFLKRKPVATIDEDKRFIEIGCNIAYDIGLYSFELNGEHTTNRETVRARYTFIYKWDGKRWLIAHHHSSAEPVAAH
jgi:uncharacterized protein (TIGR02246 family)